MRSIQAIGRGLPVLNLRLAVVLFLAVAAVALVACGDDDDDDGGGGSSSGGGSLSGSVEIDGSSTVFPITEAAAEEFRGVEGDVRVTVGVSGTGGGFERFCAGEIDISDASRPIKESEAEDCADAGIEFIEIPVAYDGLSVVVHPDNDWVTCITVEQLNTIWDPSSEGTISRWNQVDPSWPDEPIGLYGPGTDSGTFDYFTEAINGDVAPAAPTSPPVRTTTSWSRASPATSTPSATSALPTSRRTSAVSRALRSTAATVVSPRRPKRSRAASTPAFPPPIHLREEGVGRDEAPGEGLRGLLPRDRAGSRR